jgi:hypothetical protein
VVVVLRQKASCCASQHDLEEGLPELRDSIWGYFCLKALGSHRGPFAMTMRRAKDGLARTGDAVGSRCRAGSHLPCFIVVVRPSSYVLPTLHSAVAFAWHSSGIHRGSGRALFRACLCLCLCLCLALTASPRPLAAFHCAPVYDIRASAP